MHAVDGGQAKKTDNGLGRGEVVERIADVLANLADAENLPAGRVLAVDAPWGSGKSWIAERLSEVLGRRQEPARSLYINAFEFDFHHDPFVVLASAVIGAAKKGAALERLKAAAIQVITTTAPEVATGLVKTFAKTLVGEDATDAMAAAASSATEAAAKKLLDSFDETKKSTRAFKAHLTTLAKSEPGPLVIILDELDRCRPTFALEMLERIKHLFDVPGVVFALFIHGEALNSAIRQTYGQGMDPVAYLRKFVSVRMGIPKSVGRFHIEGDPVDLAAAFMDLAYPSTSYNEALRTFRAAVVAVAPTFQLTLRDIQTVMTLGLVVVRREVNRNPLEAAYGLALRIVDPAALTALRRNSDEAWNREDARFVEHPSTHPLAIQLATAIRHGVNTNRGLEDRASSASQAAAQFAELKKALAKLDLENIGTS